jgi:glycosyltransferase involved in cell wall biosynthesis
MPAVSIIVPAYNVAPYVGPALDSVLGQTFADFEALVIDDGSTDQTPAIIRQYAERDSRIRVFRQPNGGISSARNHGLRNASAPLIALLDSDDMWLPEFLATQVEDLGKHPEVDIVTGNAWFLGSHRDGQPARPTPDTRPGPDLRTIVADETIIFIMSVFRRRVYETIGGFDERLRTNEDYDFWIRAAVEGFVFARNDTPLGYYRRREDSLSASELRMLRGIIRVYDKTRPAVLDRPAVLATLDAQLARFESERLAAEARNAIETGDFAAARDHLAALYARRGGAFLALARFMAQWSPGLLARAYRLRRARLLASPSPHQGRA